MKETRTQTIYDLYKMKMKWPAFLTIWHMNEMRIITTTQKIVIVAFSHPPPSHPPLPLRYKLTDRFIIYKISSLSTFQIIKNAFRLFEFGIVFYFQTIAFCVVTLRNTFHLSFSSHTHNSKQQIHEVQLLLIFNR